MSEVLLIQFARAPVPGQVKTRMQPVLSAEAACQLHRELVLWTSQSLVSARLGPVELAVAGSTADPLFRQCLQQGVAAVDTQRGDNLGERMHNALQAGLQRFPKVLLVGSDCPQLGTDYLADAVAALDSAEVVVGPAVDGGYVLIGVSALDQRWFEGIAWGSAGVYAQTLARFATSHARWHALQPVLQDVDRPEDLPVWEQRDLELR